MDCSTAKCYSCDWDSYPSPQGYIPCALTNWANFHPSLIRVLLSYYKLNFQTLRHYFEQGSPLNDIHLINGGEFKESCFLEKCVCFERSRYIYIYIYIPIYIGIYRCIYTYIYIYIHIWMHQYIETHTHLSTIMASKSADHRVCLVDQV